MNTQLFDIDGVARVGLMFLDGDAFEEVLLDRYGHVDYDFDKFNAVKKVVMKIERINPDLGLTCIVWQQRPDNPAIALPLVAGKALPVEGWARAEVNPGMAAAFSGAPGKHERGASISHYYPVRNTDDEIVGVLELLRNRREDNDI